jgi:hypothetical protein
LTLRAKKRRDASSPREYATPFGPSKSHPSGSAPLTRESMVDDGCKRIVYP